MLHCASLYQSRFIVAAIMAALAWLAEPVRAAGPRDDLLALVPEDVGFCLVVSDLREHMAQLRDVPWVKALRDSPLARVVSQSPEATKLRAVEDQVKKQLQVGFDRLRDDLVGDAVVFAYRPGPPDKPEQEQGIVLIWARDVKLLAKVIDLLNAKVKEPERREYKGVAYRCRVDGRGHATYYYVNDHLVVFSAHEAMVRQVIERELARKQNTRDKAAPFLVEQLRRLGADKALVALWVNPRAFEAHIRKNVEAAKGPQAFVFRTFMRYWQALDGAALAISVHKEVEIKLAARARTDKLPAAVQRFLNEPTKRSEMWDRFPTDALVAGAGRIDVLAFGEFIGDFLPPQARDAFRVSMSRGLDAAFGLDFAKDVAPYLGPDWGFCITAPTDKKTLIPALTLALRVQPGPKKIAVDRAVVNSLNTFALMAVWSANQADPSARLKLRTAMQDKVEVKYVESKAFPTGFRPAFALKDGYVLLTSFSDAIQKFTKGTPASAASGDVPLLRVSLRAWGKFLTERRERLAGYLAEQDKISKEKAGQQLEALILALGLFDQLELTQQTGSGQVTWTLTLRAAESVKK
jgi:hypothetical protein